MWQSYKQEMIARLVTLLKDESAQDKVHKTTTSCLKLYQIFSDFKFFFHSQTQQLNLS